MEIRFHPEALAEFLGARSWYAQRSDRAAAGFVLEFERAVVRLHDASLRSPTSERDARKIRLRRFPFALIYRLRPDEIQVLAVAHLHRRPGYWRDRPVD